MEYAHRSTNNSLPKNTWNIFPLNENWSNQEVMSLTVTVPFGALIPFCFRSNFRWKIDPVFLSYAQQIDPKISRQMKILIQITAYLLNDKII